MLSPYLRSRLLVNRVDGEISKLAFCRCRKLFKSLSKSLSESLFKSLFNSSESRLPGTRRLSVRVGRCNPAHLVQNVRSIARFYAYPRDLGFSLAGSIQHWNFNAQNFEICMIFYCKIASNRTKNKSGTNFFFCLHLIQFYIMGSYFYLSLV